MAEDYREMLDVWVAGKPEFMREYMRSQADQALMALELLQSIGYQFAYVIDGTSFVQAVLEIETFFRSNTAEQILPLIQTGHPISRKLGNLDQIMEQSAMILEQIPPDIALQMVMELGPNYQIS